MKKSMESLPHDRAHQGALAIAVLGLILLTLAFVPVFVPSHASTKAANNNLRVMPKPAPTVYPDWYTETFAGLHEPNYRTPEIGMRATTKKEIGKRQDKMRTAYNKFTRAKYVHARDCNTPLLDRPNLNAKHITFYEPTGTDRRDQGYYSAWDCAVREAIELVKIRGVILPQDLQFIRSSKPNKRYPDILVITRSGSNWSPKSTIFLGSVPNHGSAPRVPRTYSPTVGIAVRAIGELLHEKQGGEFYYTLSAANKYWVSEMFTDWVFGRLPRGSAAQKYQQLRGPIAHRAPQN